MRIVVAFMSQKGGVGKSTLARALASVAAHGGLKVTLADLDPRQNTLLQWETLRKKNKVPPRIAVSAFTDVEAALAGTTKSDLVVLDTPGGVDASTLAIAQRAHLMVLPTGPSIDDLHPTVLLFHELVAAAIPQTRIVSAICRVLLRDEELAARSYLEDAGIEVLGGFVPESAAYRIAHNQGRSLTETPERSLNEQADTLMDGLLSKIGSLAEPTEERAPHKKGSVA